jgi:hypothetical protein
MSTWEVALGADGHVSFRGIPTLIANHLLALPDALVDDPDDAVRARLAPPPEDDPARIAEWERLMVPELFRLVASARAVVERDLVLLAQTQDLPGQGRLDIPAAHIDAWLHALQVVRLSIGAAHGLHSLDLDAWPLEEHDPERAKAILTVSILGEIQGLLVDVGTRRAEWVQADDAPGDRARPFGDSGPYFDDDDEVDDDDDDDDHDDFLPGLGL